MTTAIYRNISVCRWAGNTTPCDQSIVMITVINRKNECCTDYDIDEDDDGNVYLDRTVEHGLPILPAFGILWEF